MKPIAEARPLAAVLVLFVLLGALFAPPSIHAEGDGWELGIVAVAVKGHKCYVEVVDRPETRQRGLMFRGELEEDRGMLFVYPEARPLQFWMRNTYIPLSIAFIDEEGIIVNIEDMRPLDEKSRTRALRPVPYALEVNRGWFERRGIRPGDRCVFLQAMRPKDGPR